MPQVLASPRAHRAIGVRRRLATLTALVVLAGLVSGLKPELASASTFTFAANADAQVAAATPTTNYGRSRTLTVSSTPLVESYLRFNVSGVGAPVARARLRLWVTEPTTDGPAVYPTGTTWTERKITWSNRPARSGGALADLGDVAAGAWAELDVTTAVGGNGTYAFDLATGSVDSAIFSSKEQKGLAPQLVIETVADMTPPDTVIESGPTGDVNTTAASFSFSSTESGSTFQCGLDGSLPTLCTSPVGYTGLSAGSHSFSVRAVDGAGNVDPTPALRTWTVIPTVGGSPRDVLLAPDSGALWGAHHKVGNSLPAEDQQAMILAFESALGRTQGVDMWYEPWGNTFPQWREQWDLASGRIPMISWGKATTRDVAAGRHDAYIRARANGLKALGQPVFLRWFWEMDGSRNAKIAGSPSDYIAAWRHIRSIFAQESVTNVAWVWCPNASSFEDGSGPAFYPGDDAVDWVCADGYNFYPDDGRSYQSFSEKFTAFHDWAAARGKPAMVGEYGSQEMEPGRRAEWLDEARQALKTRLSGILAVVYFHSYSDLHDWQVTNEPDALAAFSAMGLDPYFNP